MTAAIRRGQVWTADLNPNRGRELGKIRPVLIVQGGEHGNSSKVERTHP